MAGNPHPKTTVEAPVDSISSTIVRRVAAHTEKDPIELPPLYETIDPDALDEVMTSGSAAGSSVSVRFTYAGLYVTATAEGTVELQSTRAETRTDA